MASRASTIVDGGLKGALATAKATKTGLAMLPKILGDRIELKFENGEPVQRIMAPMAKAPMIGTGSGRLRHARRPDERRG
jgi:hypothetical protein